MSDPKHSRALSTFLINDFRGILKRKGFEDRPEVIPAEHLGYMIGLLVDGHIDRQTLKLWVMETCDRAREVLDFLDYVALRSKPIGIENGNH